MQKKDVPEIASKPPPALALGFDLGGSHSRVRLVEPSGSLRAANDGPAGNPNVVGFDQACATLRALLVQTLGQAEGCPPAVGAVVIGMAGRSHGEAATLVRRAFEGYPTPPQRLLRGDGEVALYAAFGPGPGALVMAGTGSGALARGPEGLVRAGGFGAVLGDEGSGHWLGLAALRAVLQSDDGELPPTSLRGMILDAWSLESPREFPAVLGQGLKKPSELAPSVASAADAGDGVAIRLLDEAAESLARLARLALRKAGIQDEARVATAGSLLAAIPRLRDGLRAGLPPGARLCEHVYEPVSGAARWACDLLTAADVPPEW